MRWTRELRNRRCTLGVVNQAYSQRHDVLLAHLSGPLAPWLEPVMPNTAGLHLAARLVAPLDAAALAQAARRASIGLHPLAPFHLEAPVQSGFLFGYGGVDAERIDAALTSLATLLRTL
ncbi:hypothetical protein M3A49_13455 [Paraburkholderia sp. CNPSo 3076]|uniref:hypothetical protein n=1 Tax=Paraburkholderia sp. CNPSo 3076 TaxID=2940936 RepID=UPI00224C816F|nr:hypothetical protein [Paraburkholderia sp. CNPSo 3076]MCX5540488.1 hypothetical protein [Paraburkholderia sp. CNPSo 3076]